MGETLNYTPLLVIFVVAWAVPMILSWLEITKIPAVIVEIIMGVIIGPHVLAVVGNESYLGFLSYTGFLLLIFLSGLETDIPKILSSFPKKFRKIDLISNSFIVAVIIYLSSLLLSIPVSFVISLIFDIDPYFFILLFPTIALSITVPILKNEGELARKYGQIILMVGAIATIMSIILVSIYSGIIQNGFETELLLFLIIFVAFFLAYYLGRQIIKITLFKQIMYTLEHAASQIRIRGSIAVLLFFIVVASAINTEPVLGAFIAGTLLSMFLPKEKSAVLFKLDGMSYGFFIPIFFIMVGINLDISALSNFEESIPFIALLLIGFYFIQVIPSLILTKLFGVKKSLSAGVLLTARMGLTIATAQIGLSLDIIDPAANTAIVTASILTSIISPLLYKYLNHDGNKRYKIFIIGGNKTAGILGERMKMHGIDCMIVTSNLKSNKLFKSKGLDTIYAEFMGSILYKKLKIKPHDPVVILTSSDTNNAEVMRRFKFDFNHEKMITLASPQLMEFKDNSEISLIDRYEMTADQLENALLRPNSHQALEQTFNTYNVEEIKITNKAMDRKRVRDFAFHPSGSLVLLRRSKEIFIPHGDTHLLLGDIITVIGTGEALNDFRDKFI
jgi:Kef-type K+ transport system membrane component KefB/Trk K+ transport system NAD-binding subunit